MKKLLFMMIALWGGMVSARSWSIKTNIPVKFTYKCGSRAWSEEKNVAAGGYADMAGGWGESCVFKFKPQDSGEWSWEVNPGNYSSITITGNRMYSMST